MTVKNDYKFKRAASIKIPEQFFNPLKTGIKEIDNSWSEIGGIVPSQVTFITGKPGSGKTTLSLAVGACISNSVPVAFISLEMSDFQLAHQSRKIPGFGAVYVTGEFHQEQTMEFLKEIKPGLIIIDSVQKAARKMKEEDGKTMPFEKAQYSIVEMFTKYAKDTWCPVFLIGHCDKSGNYKGPSDILHDVDSHVTIEYDAESDLRTFQFGKNRFGGLFQESLFGITAETVWIGSPYITNVFSNAVITPTRPIEETVNEIGPNVSTISEALEALELNWNGSSARSIVQNMVAYLKCKDEDFESKSYIKNPQRIKLDFRGSSIIHSHPESGEIVIGKKMFTNDMNLGKIGTAKEKKAMKNRVNTRSELLVWVVIHEWIHMYKDMDKHDQLFFDTVSEKYEWFMDELK